MTSIYNTTNFSSNSYIYYVQQTCAYMHVYWFTTGGQHQAPSVEDPECSCHSPGAGHVPEDSDPDRTEKICKSSLIFIVDVIYITGTLKKICVKIVDTITLQKEVLAVCMMSCISINVGSTKYEAYNEKNHHLQAVCLHGVSRMQSLDLILTS